QLARLQGNATNLHAAFNDIGQMIRSNVLDCFEDEKSPDGINWKPLSPQTIKQRRGTAPYKILQDKGKLRSSIAFHAGSNFAEVTTDTEYAAFHQFGTSKLTPRPFFPNQTLPRNWETEILQMLESHLTH
ncbi:MAG: phage virion morphogenesis protein, partial [Methylococcaceae bacterium]